MLLHGGSFSLHRKYCAHFTNRWSILWIHLFFASSLQIFSSIWHENCNCLFPSQSIKTSSVYVAHQMIETAFRFILHEFMKCKVFDIGNIGIDFCSAWSNLRPRLLTYGMSILALYPNLELIMNYIFYFFCVNATK